MSAENRKYDGFLLKSHDSATLVIGIGSSDIAQPVLMCYKAGRLLLRPEWVQRTVSSKLTLHIIMVLSEASLWG